MASKRVHFGPYICYSTVTCKVTLPLANKPPKIKGLAYIGYDIIINRDYIYEERLSLIRTRDPSITRQQVPALTTLLYSFG